MSSSSPSAEREAFHTRLIHAPRERLYRAFIEAEHLKNWWGPNGFTSTFEIFEPVEGGRWIFTLHGPDGIDYPNENRIAELRPNERVVVEHLADTHHFFLTIGYEAAEGGATLVSWRQVFDTAEHYERVAQFVGPANEQNLDRLAAEVEKMA
jgi:uncharacterized protein YndB with AHSA1/START domain